IHVTGVAGTSVEHIGVYGQSGEGPVADFLIGGVVGAAARTHGVVGWSNEQWGVVGTSYAPMGVGVFGDGAYGVLGTSGPFGPLTFPGFTTKPGVFGTSAHQAGLVGTSDDLMGVYGYSTNNAGIVGQSGNTNSYGGFFFGDAMVTRDLTVQRNLTVGGVISPNPKAAVVPFPDGTQRLLYCMESPEVWFEDFGTARLKRGRAVVRLDPDFGRVIKRNNYRVFITPEGDCRGLYVRRKHAASFEVRELAGGKSSVMFSYRIVAHRKDIRGYTRFAKIDPRFAKLDKPLDLP